MPAVAIILAIVGSFSSHASEKSTSAIVPGYTLLPTGTVCINIANCSNIPSPVLCSVIYQSVTYQVFGKEHPNDTACITFLFRPI